MLTDSPLHKANVSAFMESDRITTLDLAAGWNLGHDRQVHQVCNEVRRGPGRPSMDADCREKRNHVFRNVPEYPLPRILPSSRFSAIWIRGFLARARLLRASRCSLSSCAWNGSKTTLLGSRAGQGVPNRFGETSLRPWLPFLVLALTI